MDIAFVLDGSGSVGSANWDLMIQFVLDLVRDLPVSVSEVHIAFVTFSTNAQVEYYFNRYYDVNGYEFERTMRDIRYPAGNTNTAAALRLLMDDVFQTRNGHRTSAEKIGIIFTDGEPTVDTALTFPYADEAKNLGIDLYSIGIGDAVNADTIRRLSSNPQQLNKNYFLPKSFANLDEQLSQVLIQQACFTCSQSSGDLVFVIDSSGSINDDHPDNWDKVLKFIADTARQLDLGDGSNNNEGWRMAMIVFSDVAKVEFNLLAYKSQADKPSLIANILRTPYMGRTTNTNQGLLYMLDQFNQYDRAGVPNYAIVISDGNPNLEVEALPGTAARVHSYGQGPDQQIKTFAIGITQNVDMAILEMIASAPKKINETIFTTTNFDNLAMVTDQIVTETCGYPKPTGKYHCRQTAEAGWMCFCEVDDCDIRPMNGTQCTNIDECEIDNGRCDYECIDTDGSYECRCPSGYTLSANKKKCDDVNECLGTPCNRNDVCVNSEGGYYCLSPNSVVSQGLIGSEAAGAAVAASSTQNVALSATIAGLAGILATICVVMAVRAVRNRQQRKKQQSKSAEAKIGISGRLFGDSLSGFNAFARAVEENNEIADDELDAVSSITDSTISERM